MPSGECRYPSGTDTKHPALLGTCSSPRVGNRGLHPCSGFLMYLSEGNIANPEGEDRI